MNTLKRDVCHIYGTMVANATWDMVQWYFGSKHRHIYQEPIAIWYQLLPTISGTYLCAKIVFLMFLFKPRVASWKGWHWLVSHGN